MTPIVGLGRVAVLTPDVDRLVRFYVEVLGLQHLVTTEMDLGPHRRPTAVVAAPGCVLHFFEEPGFDPIGTGPDDQVGRRGRIDHFSLMVQDLAALEAVGDRLVAAGASDGEIRPTGPVCTLRFVDPDGGVAEVSCPNAAFACALGPEGLLDLVDPGRSRLADDPEPTPAG